MKTRFYMLYLLCLIGQGIIMAQNTFQGKVVNENGESIFLANVVLMNSSDSTFLAGCTTDENGLFNLAVSSNGILRISHIGYVSKYIPITTDKYLSVVMETDAAKLKEVVVRSPNPITTIEGDALVTRIKGTVLAKIGSAKDVLGLLPGLIDNQGSIEVFGKGRPTYYINGRLIRNTTEIDRLKSEKIIKVEVVTNPGARYNATVNSVIRITIEKAKGEGISIDSKTQIGYKDYLYGDEEISLNYRKDNWDVFGMLEYERAKTKGNSLNIQNTWLSSHYMQNIGLISKKTSQLLGGQLGFAYSISSKHSFGLYYKASHKDDDEKSVYDAESWIENDLSEIYLIDQQTDEKNTENLVDSYYSGKIGKWTLDASFNALWKNNNENDYSIETNDGMKSRRITTNNDIESRLYAGEVHVSRPLWKGVFKLGTMYTDSRREDGYYNPETVVDNSDNRIDEKNTAFYIETAQKLGKMRFQVGVRYEHVNNEYFDHKQKVSEQSRNYDKIFPSASVVFPVKKSIFQLSYTKKYNRPHYSQLCNKISYVNRYLYQSGNPLLQTSFSDNISFNYKYGWFMLTTNYSHVEDKIITSCVPYKGNNTITILKNENSNYDLDNLQVMVSLTPSFSNKYYPALNFGVLSQFYSVDYCGKKKDLKDPVGIIRFNNVLALSKECLLNINFSWRGKGHTENINVGDSWFINIGLTKTLGKHWNLKLAANDIFNSAKASTYTTYSDVRDIYIRKNVSTRSVEFTLRYNFNKTKSNYKGKGAGKTEKERL